ncbi:hypothetical protein D3C76_1624150 [compost metagenome]
MLALRRVSRPTAWAAKFTLAVSKACRSPPSRLSRTNPAKAPKRRYRALRMAAPALCGKIAALTTVATTMPSPTSSKRQTACMKAASGCSVAGMPISAAV